VTVLAFVRPDEWELPLFVHVLGAMVLVAALTLAATSLVGAGRENVALSTRLAFRSLLWVAVPAWIVMRVGAQLVADKEGYKGDDDPTWVGLGYAIAEPTLLFLIAATVVTGIGARRAARDGGGSGLSRAGLILSVLLIVAYLVAIWAMTVKPT
jgi:hypothetical protein